MILRRILAKLEEIKTSKINELILNIRINLVVNYNLD